MRLEELLREKREEILRLAAKHGARNVRVFGSVARGEADEQSDLDLLVEGEMRPNEAGRIVERCWLDIPNHFPHATLDAFIVMPNHVHGIIVLSHATKTERFSATSDRPVNTTVDPSTAEQVEANDHSPLPSFRSPSRTIGSIVRGSRSASRTGSASTRTSLVSGNATTTSTSSATSNP
jgi:hypothetical protein